MEKLEREFKLANIFAMSGWFCLMILPTWQYTHFYVLNIAFVLLAILYIYLLKNAMTAGSKANSKSGDEEGSESKDKPSFSNLRGVLALLRNPEGALTAWVHILAFDLIVGFYIHQEGTALNISHWYLLPCYILALMLGPIGLLSFICIKFLVV